MYAQPDAANDAATADGTPLATSSASPSPAPDAGDDAANADGTSPATPSMSAVPPPDVEKAEGTPTPATDAGPSETAVTAPVAPPTLAEQPTTIVVTPLTPAPTIPAPIVLVPKFDLIRTVLATLEKALKVENPMPIETFVGPGGELMVRFLKLKGVAPAYPILVNGKPNPTIIAVLRREMVRYEIPMTQETIAKVFWTLFGEAIYAHDYDPFEKSIVKVLHSFAVRKASIHWWEGQMGALHQECLFIAAQQRVETKGWNGSGWFSATLKLHRRELEAVGVQIEGPRNTSQGEIVRIRYRGSVTNHIDSDASDAISPTLPAEVIHDLRRVWPNSLLLNGQPDKVRPCVDRLTKGVMCEHPLMSGEMCGACPACKLYAFDDKLQPGEGVWNTEAWSLHMNAQGKTADALLSKLLQYQLAPQFVAVIEDVTEAAAGFQEALANAIQKDNRGLWILTTQSGGHLLSELAQVVKHHVVL